MVILVIPPPLLGKQPLTVTRRGAGAYVNGVWVAGASTSIPIYGSLQPPAAANVSAWLDTLEEGLRERAQWLLFTGADLICGAKSQQPDLITIDGELCEVHAKQDWSHAHALRHKVYVLVKPERPEVAPT